MQKPMALPMWSNRALIENISINDAVELYRIMALIRNVQIKIEDLYHLDEMKTPVHLSIGQEAIAAGVCYALGKDDYVFSNHRGHAHYLAKGGDLKRMIAELYCRETGCAHGYGGSMHLVDTSVGVMGNSSIVGGGIPIATGAALSAKLKGDGRVVVAFFGDGAAEEGVLYESINFALLKRLPILYACENNFYAVCSPISNRQCNNHIYHKFQGMGIPCYQIDGTDVVAVYNQAKEIVRNLRNQQGPVFVEYRAYRWRGHAGAGADTNLGYRPEEELNEWVKIDPLEVYKRELIKGGFANDQIIADINMQVGELIEKAFAFAQSSPLPSGLNLKKWLFAPEEVI